MKNYPTSYSPIRSISFARVALSSVGILTGLACIISSPGCDITCDNRNPNAIPKQLDTRPSYASSKLKNEIYPNASGFEFQSANYITYNN